LERSGKISVLIAVMYLLLSAPFSPLTVEVKAQPDSATIQYSLFSEYFKNKDYSSALPYGWKVFEMEPLKFAQWYYFKMEDLLWYMHDSSDISAAEKKDITDRIEEFYDQAMEHYPEGSGHFQVRKAFVKETWLDESPEEVIKEYELAAEINPEIDNYYYLRLGELYEREMNDNNDYKSKALDLYTMLSEKEPDNPAWNTKLEGLVDNIDELVLLAERAWNLDKENIAKAWKYASLAMRAGSYEKAIVALEFLTNRDPQNANYLNQLATAYQRLENINKAEETIKKLIALEPNRREHYLNLGILYKDKGQYAAARTQYQRASEVGGGWGLPIYYEGLLYEQAARGCTFDFETKMVYQLAVDTYRKARNLEPTLTQAQERITLLASSVPSQEEYFFKGYKSGQTLPVNGSCFGWISRSITVP
jgi:tetratricopeptide (TPR) repeat protein